MGSTGAGKTDLVKNVLLHLGIDPEIPMRKVLVDDLIETDPTYKQEVLEIISSTCGSYNKNIGACIDNNFLQDPPNQDILDQFASAYFKRRKQKGCNGQMDKSCDELNDEHLTQYIDDSISTEGIPKVVVFETTGLNRIDWLFSAFEGIRQFDVVFAYSLVNVLKLKERNKSRLKHAMLKFQKDPAHNHAPRLPDLTKLDSISENIRDRIEENLQLCKTIGGRMLIYSNNQEVTQPMHLIFDSNSDDGDLAFPMTDINNALFSPAGGHRRSRRVASKRRLKSRRKRGKNYTRLYRKRF